MKVIQGHPSTHSSSSSYATPSASLATTSMKSSLRQTSLLSVRLPFPTRQAVPSGRRACNPNFWSFSSSPTPLAWPRG